MWEEILKALTVYFFSTLKFAMGPMLGFAERLHFITTNVATIAGMMTSVIVVTNFSGWIRRRFFRKKSRERSEQERRRRERWKRYGLLGVAALTPVILTPIGGTLLATGSGSPKQKIYIYMLISAIFWSLTFSSLIYFFGSKLLDQLPEFLR